MYCATKQGPSRQIQTCSDLPLEAQLNVDTDRLARAYQDNMDMPKAAVYLFLMQVPDYISLMTQPHHRCHVHYKVH